jgi:hypothetical protein
MHPDAFGILNTHYLLGSGGNFGPQARLIYDALRDLPNVRLMTGGHIAAESRRVDMFEGNTVHSMLADYQGRVDGGQGYLRLWEFSPMSGTVSVRTYSPTLDRFETDANSEFTIEVDLRGFGGAFRRLGVTDVDPADPAATSVAVDGLAPGRTYEWYAVIESCGHRVETPLQRFTTVEAMARAPGDRQRSQAVRLPRRPPVMTGPVDGHADDPSLAD